MTRLSAFFLAFLLGTASAVALVACGSGEDADLLPGTTADQIESKLTAVEELADAGDCIGAEEAVAQVTEEVEELEGVDLRLKAALEEGTDRLSVLVGGCEEETTSAEPEPSPETDVEAEAVEEDEKPKKDKPKTEDGESSEPEEEPSEDGEGPDLPPQAEGEGEEKGGGAGEPEPEAEETPSAGGVGPSVGVDE